MSRNERKYNNARHASNSYNYYHGPSPPALRTEYAKYEEYAPRRYGQPVHNYKSQFPAPGFNYTHHGYGGAGGDESTKARYTKKYYQEGGEKLLSSCSTGSSEDDNMKLNEKSYKRPGSVCVVYLNGMPVFQGEPTADDTEILMYSFVRKHGEKFVCSELKNGPADVKEVPLPSFLE